MWCLVTGGVCRPPGLLEGGNACLQFLRHPQPGRSSSGVSRHLLVGWTDRATGDDAKFLAGIEKLIGTTIPEVALDGFAVEAADKDDGAKPAAARRSSSRKPREAAPERRPREAPPERAEQPVQTHSDEPEPARRRASRPEREKHEPARRAPQESRRRYRDDEDHDEADNVVGFGNRIPAFLQLAPRPRRG